VSEQISEFSRATNLSKSSIRWSSQNWLEDQFKTLNSLHWDSSNHFPHETEKQRSILWSEISDFKGSHSESAASTISFGNLSTEIWATNEEASFCR
jgi:hypothetical protein